MKKEKLEEKIKKQAEGFKKRAKKDDYGKRHDRIRPDEIKAMCLAFRQLDWSFPQIGESFDRDPRQVRHHLEKKQETKQAARQPEAEQVPIQLAHLRALLAFLKEDPVVRKFFPVDSPATVMEHMLSQIEKSRQLGTPHILLVERRFPWENLPIAGWLRDHIPQHHMWQHIEEFKTTKSEYRRSIRDIAVALRADFEDALGFPATDIMGSSDEQRLLLGIFNWVTGQLLGRLNHHQRTALSLGTRTGGKVGESSFGLYWGGTYYAPGTEEQIECARRVLDQIIDGWLYSEDIRAVVYRFHSLEKLAQTIMADIDQMDETALEHGTCPECPKLKSKQEARD